MEPQNDSPQFTVNENLHDNIVDTNNERLNNLESSFEKWKEKEFPTQFIFVNKSLNMNSGKAAAQCAHAVEELTFTILEQGSEEKQKEFKKALSANPRATIILEVANEEEMYKLNSYLESQDIWTGIYVDEMVGDKKFVPTALAVEYLDRSEAKAKLLSSMFNKFTSIQEQLTDKYQKALTEIRDLALDSYLGRVFAGGLKDDMLEIRNKVYGVMNDETK